MTVTFVPRLFSFLNMPYFCGLLLSFRILYTHWITSLSLTVILIIYMKSLYESSLGVKLLLTVWTTFHV
ncbi:hypothetical protein VNO78_18697 [Psophocarpus tetragonolobus]|uniref:Uncharacterized protein n=1 Tax=Psophocarpus tetragonolobus TaxID=3891 RepID=A0AAN9S7X1_PSOTE